MSNIFHLLVIEIRPSPPPTGKANSFDIYAVAPALVAALAAALGWMFVERFARARERRADIRTLITAFEAAVEDIVQSACTYYALAGSDARAIAIGTAIKAKLSRLHKHLEVLSTSGLKVDANDQLKVFRQTVTGGEFESFNRIAQPEGSHLYMKVANAGQDLSGTVKIELFRRLAETKPAFNFRKKAK